LNLDDGFVPQGGGFFALSLASAPIAPFAGVMPPSTSHTDGDLAGQFSVHFWPPGPPLYAPHFGTLPGRGDVLTLPKAYSPDPTPISGCAAERRKTGNRMVLS
jgi:hypothetical protein